MIPSSTQWNKWTLPSKLTAMGTLLGLFSIAYTLTIDLIGSYYLDTYNYYIDDFKELGDGKYFIYNERMYTENLKNYIDSGEMSRRQVLSNKIGKSISEGITIFIRLKLSINEFNDIKWGDEGYKISLPKVDLTERDAYEISADHDFGPEQLSVFLEGMSKSKSGFDEVFYCKKTSTYHLSGFYKFSALGQAQGYKPVFGRLVTVDSNIATNTLRMAAMNDVCYEL